MISEKIQSGDWKGEKHVPVINIEKAEKGSPVKIRLSVGEEISHPNTFEHYIAWFKLFFQGEGSAHPVEVAHIDFKAHGEDGLTTEYKAKVQFNTEKNGKVYAVSYCNIHGLWQSEADLVLK